MGYLLHNEPLARASSEQKDHYYAATRGEAQRESQGRQASGGLYPISTAPNKTDRKPTALWHDKPEAPKPIANQPKHSQPNVGRPQAPKLNAKPPKSFFHGLATVFRGPKEVPRSYLDAQQQGKGLTKVLKRQG
ncbi:MAG: hypothetical protein PG981_001313 [Wolbachia endosymbiont of Ctenocephalides orientis wCori]|nr:MAG: hypothetical protein PG981_001313 [Wolbachia endosymbiont of Ctenocephalides orientis wCori]